VVLVMVSQKAKATDTLTACATRMTAASTAAVDTPTIVDGRASRCNQSDKGTIRAILSGPPIQSSQLRISPD
jgi:hypothetical protein